VAKSGDAVDWSDAEVGRCEPEVGGNVAEVGGREGVGGWQGNSIFQREGLAYGSSLRARGFALRARGFALRARGRWGLARERDLRARGRGRSYWLEARPVAGSQVVGTQGSR
jgi:hypothetical protein